jgi:hypothetical protein
MPEIESITPSLAGEVWLKSVRYPFLNQAVTVDDVQPVDREARMGIFPVRGRSAPVGMIDVRASRAYILTLLTKTDTAHRKLDLTLMAGDVFFLHVPPTRRILPGSMFVAIGTVTKHRVDQKLPAGVADPWFRFTLPLVELAAPGPDVVGGTLTWGTVLNLYGSWEALVSAHPTWADLLDTVGSPEDLVTL